MKYYCFYDVVTSEFGPLFAAINDADCKRKLAVSQRNNPYMADLRLYYVGECSQDTAVFSMPDGGKPVFIANLTDFCSFEQPVGA
ncbi:nonstructural protein [Sigmofec virus UA08Rod_6476]|uniref:Nonstructural protein n=1 Tax=Sigmofec virus UA08Rod_6476 TaxID=2929231 RepID=A0A976R773_9VIRU|nr:nonstructural protein [Sigmofec virus UA08Rod_6476]